MQNIMKQAEALATETGCSVETARRHLRRGTTPSEGRCIGKDGKTYPRGGNGFRSPLHQPLAIARSNIRRAARADTFTDGDMEVLKDILNDAVILNRQWEIMRDTHDEFNNT